jgi:hypothetical protein
VFLLVSHSGHAAPVRDQEIAALSARLFPALTALSQAPNRHALRLDTADAKAVAAMLAARRVRMAACGQAPACLFAAAAWSAPERDLLASAVQVAKTRASSRALAPDDGERAEILRELAGLNHILDVYGLGAAPRYPDIDGPGMAPGSELRKSYVADAVALGEADAADRVSTLDPSIALALALLDAADRDTAAAFEPLDARYNGPAFARARSVDWSRYLYTAIIVPGIGPDDLATPLSAGGKLNVRMAAARFFDGVAPYIIVSGGGVHPRGTSHVEALEMRKALIERYGVPAKCIVVDPYARHTTTNLRNASRRLSALGAPLDRDALIITNPGQSAYIESAEFADRNRVELGYQPGAVGARLSPSELLFRPAIASLRVDPMDPLDP